MYFDYVMIYSTSKSQHLEHKQQTLYANLKKCSFISNQVVFLGFIVSSNGMSTDPKKIRAIVDWPEPRNIHDVDTFYGLAIFYRQFIKGFRSIMAPITNYICKREFTWTKSATQAF